MYFFSPDWPECRPPVSCSGTAPEPTEESGLLANNATVTLEFQEATYFCKEYSSLSDQTVFKVLCGLNGSYPETVNWPECQPTHCTEAIPTITGFKSGKVNFT